MNKHGVSDKIKAIILPLLEGSIDDRAEFSLVGAECMVSLIEHLSNVLAATITGDGLSDEGRIKVRELYFKAINKTCIELAEATKQGREEAKRHFNERN